MQAEANDRDGRNTAHADLRFSLLDQTPRIPASHMFHIDAITGEVSLTEDGNEHNDWNDDFSATGRIRRKQARKCESSWQKSLTVTICSPILANQQKHIWFF